MKLYKDIKGKELKTFEELKGATKPVFVENYFGSGEPYITIDDCLWVRENTFSATLDRGYRFYERKRVPYREEVIEFWKKCNDFMEDRGLMSPGAEMEITEGEKLYDKGWRISKVEDIE